MSKAFSLIELLVITAIIIILTALVVPNYRGGDRQLALQRSASKLAQDLRRAQEMAMSSQEFAGRVPRGGYGLFSYISFPDQYVLFADLNNDGLINLPAEEVERIKLEKGIKFSSFYLDGLSAGVLLVVFTPPDPKTCIGVGCANGSAGIVLSLEKDLTINRNVSINSAGLVAIE